MPTLNSHSSFFDTNILALKVDGKEEFAFLVNENNFSGDLNSIGKVLNFLDRKYLKMIPQDQIEISSYDIDYEFTEGLAVMYKTKNRIDYYGYIDVNGNETIPFQYEYGENFSEGLALVRQNRKFGFIDNKGKVIIPFKFDDADSFKHRKARVRIKKHQFYVDKAENET